MTVATAALRMMLLHLLLLLLHALLMLLQSRTCTSSGCRNRGCIHCTAVAAAAANNTNAPLLLADGRDDGVDATEAGIDRRSTR